MHLMRALTLAAVLAAVGCSSAEKYEATSVGKVAPTFTLKNQDGKPVSLEGINENGWAVIAFYAWAGSWN